MVELLLLLLLQLLLPGFLRPSSLWPFCLVAIFHIRVGARFHVKLLHLSLWISNTHKNKTTENSLLLVLLHHVFLKSFRQVRIRECLRLSYLRLEFTAYLQYTVSLLFTHCLLLFSYNYNWGCRHSHGFFLFTFVKEKFNRNV